MTALASIVAAIEPPGDALSVARARLAGFADDMLALTTHAIRLAGARHVPIPPVTRRHLLVCAADASEDTAAATQQVVTRMARGRDALNTLARAGRATVTLVNCGFDTGPHPDSAVVNLDMPLTTPANHQDALAYGETVLERGIALVLSLAGAGLDVLALGQLGPCRCVPAVVRSLAQGADPVAVLGYTQASELGVLAGAVLAAATLRIPVITDEVNTPIAAWLATRMAPQAAHYVFLGHATTTEASCAAAAALQSAPLLDACLAAGRGAGAVVALPMLDAAAQLLRDCAAGPYLPLAPTL